MNTLTKIYLPLVIITLLLSANVQAANCFKQPSGFTPCCTPNLTNVTPGSGTACPSDRGTPSHYSRYDLFIPGGKTDRYVDLNVHSVNYVIENQYTHHITGGECFYNENRETSPYISYIVIKNNRIVKFDEKAGGFSGLKVPASGKSLPKSGAKNKSDGQMFGVDYDNVVRELSNVSFDELAKKYDEGRLDEKKYDSVYISKSAGSYRSGVLIKSYESKDRYQPSRQACLSIPSSSSSGGIDY